MKVELRQLPNARLDFIPPMLARPVNKLPSGRDWLYELKLDGYRVLVLKQRRVITLFSRRRNNLTNRFPSIARASSFLPNKTILDGELVVLDDTGKPTFAALHKSRFTPDALYYYDDVASPHTRS